MSDHGRLRGMGQEGPWHTMAIADAQQQLGAVAAYVATNRRDIALTNADGGIIALVISPEVLEGLEDDLAIARNKLHGGEGTPQEEFMQQLGEDV